MDVKTDTGSADAFFDVQRIQNAYDLAIAVLSTLFG